MSQQESPQRQSSPTPPPLPPAAAAAGSAQPADTPGERVSSAAAPAWFRPRSTVPAGNGAATIGQPHRRERRPADRQPLINTSGCDEQPLPVGERIRLWFLGAPGLSYALSVIFHAVLLLVMGVIIYHELQTDNDRGTLLVNADESELVSIDDIDTRIELPQLADNLIPPEFQTALPSEIESEFQLPDSFLDQLPSVGAAGDGTGGGRDLLLPKSENSVSKGSFTAWTIPEDPTPRTDYLIVIEIRLPDSVRKYRVSDLSGTIIGTDLYTQAIPIDHRNPSATRTQRDGRLVVLRNSREYLPIEDHTAQLVILVPGAADLVRDRIKVRSRVLKEHQELEIEF